MATTAFVRARIDEALKNEATSVLADMGLTVSDVVRIVLTRIAKEHALPFMLHVPNAETREAMEEASTIGRSRFASADDPMHDLRKIDDELEISAINATGGGFEWLADEPDLYSDADLVERYRS